MQVYRIVLEKYSEDLLASGRSARWNGNDVKLIYTSSSCSLACLENIVHRSKLGLSASFRVLTIEIPNNLPVEKITLDQLPENWNTYEQMHLTQAIGNNWVLSMQSCVLQVPSAIIAKEFNYLINPGHPDFEKIILTEIEPFLFDDRVKN